MTKLRNEIEKALDDNLSYGYEFQMSDYAVSKEQEKEYYKQGRKEVKKATSQILSLLEQSCECNKKKLQPDDLVSKDR